jgi:Lon protease-like protein
MGVFVLLFGLATGFLWRGQNLYLRNPESLAPFAPDVAIPLPTSGAGVFDVDAPLGPLGDERLALLPESAPAFLHSKNVLFVYELRFRQLLNDIYDDNKYFVRAFVDSSGAIEPVQLKCRITECKRLVTGQAIYIIEGESRVELQGVRMSGNGQYLMAEVNELPDQAGAVGDAETERLCRDVFSHLKAYLRLARRVPSIETNEDPDSLRYLCLSPAITASWHEKDAATFSHAVANLVSTVPIVMHQLFAGTVKDRLAGLVRILVIALDDLKVDLTNSGIVTEMEVEGVVVSSADPCNSFADLMPPLDFKELSLDGIEMDFEDDVIMDSGVSALSVGNGGEGGQKEEEKDLWGADAFQ